MTLHDTFNLSLLIQSHEHYEQLHNYIIFCVFLLTPYMSQILWVTFFSQSLKKRYPFNVTGHILHPYKMKGMFDLLMDDAFHFKWYFTCSDSRKRFDFLKLVEIHSPVNFCFTRTYSHKGRQFWI